MLLKDMYLFMERVSINFENLQYIVEVVSDDETIFDCDQKIQIQNTLLEFNAFMSNDSTAHNIEALESFIQVNEELINYWFNSINELEY